MNRIFDVFLGRPRLAAAIAIAALIAGFLSCLSLPVAFYPTVARPTISVSCSYPGANSLEVMNTVAGPLEDRVNGVEGFDHMTSSCSDTGSYSLTVVSKGVTEGAKVVVAGGFKLKDGMKVSVVR